MAEPPAAAGGGQMRSTRVYECMCRSHGVPGRPGGCENSDLVALADITPSMMQFAGCETPDYLDFQPLPGLGLQEARSRACLYGMMADGWMAYDGRYKLSKYATDEHMLFDLQEDSAEVTNLIHDEAHRPIFEHLDSALTREIMRSVLAARHDQLVYHSDLSSDESFGQRGWQRTYPQPL